MTFEEIAKSAMTLTEAESQKVANQIVKEYSTALRAMNEEIKTVYANLTGSKPEDYFNYMTKYNRLALMIEDTQKKYLAVSRIVGKETMAAADSAISNSYYRNLYAGNFGAPADGIFVALDQKVINVSVYGTPEAWKTISDTATFGRSETYMPQSGTLIDQLIVKRNAQVIQDIESAIRSGLMAGESYSKMAARVKKIMDTDAWKALRIVNTETHRNQMAGQYASMMAMRSEGLEAKRMIVSTLDTRTRPQSAQVDGQVEDSEGYFHYPNGLLVAIPGNSGSPAFDINDREACIMTVDGMPPEVRRGRDPVTGQTDIISWSSFDDWMKANNLSYDKSGKMVYK